MKPGSPTEFVLDTSKLKSWEIAARLHMLVTYPGQKPERRERLVNAACADQIRVFLERCPAVRKTVIAKYPQYMPEANRTQMTNIIQDIENTQRAGRAVLTLIKATDTGQLPIFRGEQRHLTLDFTTQILWPRRANEDEETYLQRVHSLEQRKVRGHYPVAHLAAAWAYLANEMGPTGAPTVYSYLDRNFHRRWVAKANQFAESIRKTRGLENMAEQLIDIRWIEPKQDSVPSRSR